MKLKTNKQNVLEKLYDLLIDPFGISFSFWYLCPIYIICTP